MAEPLLGKTVAVIGGDGRQASVVRSFLTMGARVQALGVPGVEGVPGVLVCNSFAEALAGAAIVLLPVQGVRDDGVVYTEAGVPPLQFDEGALRQLAPGAIFFVGLGSRYLRALLHGRGLRLIEFREADEFAIYNSIPSAEGAIQMAMEAAPFTIFGSQALVLGFGRTGRTLAQQLKGLGSRVTVVARGRLERARAYAAGHEAVSFERLPAVIGQADLLFNTVPAPVVTREVLTQARPTLVLIDLASAPGGTDWQAARELGLAAQLAPGLPAKVAPLTAGQIIADTVLRYLEELSETGVGRSGAGE